MTTAAPTLDPALHSRFYQRLQRRYAEAEEILQALVGENELYVDAYDWLSRTREAAGELEAARNVLTNEIGRAHV